MEKEMTVCFEGAEIKGKKKGATGEKIHFPWKAFLYITDFWPRGNGLTLLTHRKK